jgi:hypothetical protein
MLWLADQPDLTSVLPVGPAPAAPTGSLRRNEGYTAAGINQLPLLPGILVASPPDGDGQRVVARGALGCRRRPLPIRNLILLAAPFWGQE